MKSLKPRPRINMQANMVIFLKMFQKTALLAVKICPSPRGFQDDSNDHPESLPYHRITITHIDVI
jgi:hypothetical protein